MSFYKHLLWHLGGINTYSEILRGEKPYFLISWGSKVELIVVVFESPDLIDQNLLLQKPKPLFVAAETLSRVSLYPLSKTPSFSRSNLRSMAAVAPPADRILCLTVYWYYLTDLVTCYCCILIRISCCWKTLNLNSLCWDLSSIFLRFTYIVCALLSFSLKLLSLMQLLLFW